MACLAGSVGEAVVDARLLGQRAVVFALAEGGEVMLAKLTEDRGRGEDDQEEEGDERSTVRELPLEVEELCRTSCYSAAAEAAYEVDPTVRRPVGMRVLPTHLREALLTVTQRGEVALHVIDEAEGGIDTTGVLTAPVTGMEADAAGIVTGMDYLSEAVGGGGGVAMTTEGGQLWLTGLGAGGGAEGGSRGTVVLHEDLELEDVQFLAPHVLAVVGGGGGTQRLKLVDTREVAGGRGGVDVAAKERGNGGGYTAVGGGCGTRPDLVICGGAEGGVHCYDIRKSGATLAERTCAECQPHSGRVNQIVVTDAGGGLSASSDGTALFWDVNTIADSTVPLVDLRAEDGVRVPGYSIPQCISVDCDLSNNLAMILSSHGDVVLWENHPGLAQVP